MLLVRSGDLELERLLQRTGIKAVTVSLGRYTLGLWGLWRFAAVRVRIFFPFLMVHCSEDSYR